MSYLSLEGTADYIAAYPALMTTFVASGSITAGNLVTLYSDNGWAGKSRSVLGSGSDVGLAYQSVSDSEKVGIIVWGYVKNVVATGSVGYADPIMSSDLGKAQKWTTGSWNDSAQQGRKCNGKAITTATDGNKFLMFLDCMR